MMRIVSLVPSLTQTLVEIGYRQNIVGMTQFCVEPSDLHRSTTIVGGTKDPSIEKIKQLNPTHIFVNEEENRKEDVEVLQRDFNIINTFPKGPGDVGSMLRIIGGNLAEDSRANRWYQLADEIDTRFESLRQTPVRQRVLYFIWKQPYMVVGADTYISRALSLFGFENAFDKPERYPVVELDKWKGKVDTLLLSTEPFPFRKRDLPEFQAGGWNASEQILKIDGQLFSWYGSKTLDLLKEAIEFKKNQGCEYPWLRRF